MSFPTLTFLLFLAVVFTAYWSLRRREHQNLLLVVASYVFYGWWDPRFCLLMLGSSLVDYFVCRGMERQRGGGARRALLGASLAANIGLLGFFKYYGFFVESAADLLATLGFQVHIHTLSIVLPVGISFYTFQTLSYTIDVYRGKSPVCHRIVDYLAYVSFFPQLVAGPIERATHLLPQFMSDRRFDPALAADGLRQVLWGFFKKMVIADNLAPYVDVAFADPSQVGAPQLALGALFFTFQIYCDFSGYSDIAIGTGRLFGFSIMRNFAYPYFSMSPAEFWRRWHISLLTWFRDYVYIPLGGSRCPAPLKARNAILTFGISGLWHGASWNFIAWGLLNGLAVLPAILAGSRGGRRRVSDTPGGERDFPLPATVFAILGTFTFAMMGWVVFRAETLADAVVYYQRWLGGAVADWIDPEVQGLQAGTLLLLLAAFVLAEWVQRRHDHVLAVGGLPAWLRWTIYLGLAWACLGWGTFAQGDFIYFQF